MSGPGNQIEMRLILLIAAFVIAGSPLVAYLWETLSDVVAGQPDPRRLIISIPLAVLLVVLLRLAAVMLKRMESSPG